MPDRVEALEKRLAVLELAAASSGRSMQAPGKACPSCGALAFRVKSSRKSPGPFGQLGALERVYACEACQFTETRDGERDR